MDRDEQRIEEEIAGAVRPERRRSLSSGYLRQAVDALSEAGDPSVLYRHWRDRPPTTEPLITMVADAAREAHVTFCRTAVLFAALAAEAYVNEFLAVHMDDEEFARRERAPTVEKYKKWTKRAYGQTIFATDREPIPELVELFQVRDRLVHPKPGFGDGGLFEPSVEFRALFAPPRAARFIVAAGGAASVMMRRSYGFDYVDPVAEAIWQGRETLYQHATEIANAPTIDAIDPMPLFARALERSVSKQKAAGLADIPELSVNRILGPKADHPSDGRK
jgi:hypothetical protein